MSEGNWSVGLGIIEETVRGWVHGPTVTQEDLESLRSGLNYANRSLTVAETVAEFRQRSGAVERLQRARRGIGAILQVLDAIQIFRDIDGVRAAVQELNRIGNVGRNPAGAARAFGQLFSSLGRLSGHLPAPANAYSDFLSESAEFFTNMLSAIDPDQRWQNREDWREAMGRR